MKATEKLKKTYQKHKTEKKITVKHYVNMALGKKIGDDEGKIYPIYVEITFNRKTARFRSQIPCTYWNYMNDEDDNEYEYCDYVLGVPDNNKAELKSLSGDLKNVIEQDTYLITTIIEDQYNYNPETFNINYIPKIYHSEYYNLTFFIEWCLRNEIYDRVKEIDKKVGRYFIQERENFRTNKYAFSPEIQSINHLEFYKKNYPEIDILRTEFSSKIWFLEIYAKTLKHPYYNRLHNHFGRKYQNNFGIFNLNPTILDFKSGYFQKVLLDTFQNERQEIEHIINDIEYLFQNKYYEYKDTFISFLPKKIGIREKQAFY